MSGKLYMIPVTLGDSDPTISIPDEVITKTLSLRLFAVEDIRSARRWLRKLDSHFPIDETQFFLIGKHSDPAEASHFLSIIESGSDGGVMSEAGMPGVADPGAVVVAGAHQRAIRVIPLSGPSSVALALAASGLNGQAFAFNGYLPHDKQQRRDFLRRLEKRSQSGETQIFMEAPFRNRKLVEDILATCNPETRLCIAADLTLPGEFIRTLKVAEWSEELPDIDRRPALFLILA